MMLAFLTIVQASQLIYSLPRYEQEVSRFLNNHDDWLSARSIWKLGMGLKNFHESPMTKALFEEAMAKGKTEFLADLLTSASEFNKVCILGRYLSDHGLNHFPQLSKELRNLVNDIPPADRLTWYARLGPVMCKRHDLLEFKPKAWEDPSTLRLGLLCVRELWPREQVMSEMDWSEPIGLAQLARVMAIALELGLSIREDEIANPITKALYDHQRGMPMAALAEINTFPAGEMCDYFDPRAMQQAWFDLFQIVAQQDREQFRNHLHLQPLRFQLAFAHLHPEYATDIVLPAEMPPALFLFPRFMEINPAYLSWLKSKYPLEALIAQANKLKLKL